MVNVRENCGTYTPPAAVRPSVERLLRGVEPGHLLGIKAVVLTASTMLGAGKTRRVKGRKYRQKACLGFYHGRWHKSAPWIELVVDNIVRGFPTVLLNLKFVTDLLLAQTVFHEVGHHLEKTIGAPSRSGEDAAEAWRVILTRRYFRSRYPVVSFVLRALRPWRWYRPGNSA